MKTHSHSFHPLINGLGLLLLLAMACARAGAAAPVAWPWRIDSPPFRVALYEPQVEAQAGEWLTARAAFAVSAREEEPHFGAVWFRMRMRVDRDERRAAIVEFRTEALHIPEQAAASETTVRNILERDMPGAVLDLDALLASLRREEASIAAASGADALPDIIWVPYPATVVRIDGAPELQPMPDSNLYLVVNSDTFIVMSPKDSRWYLRHHGEWLTAPAVHGPWTDLAEVPDDVRQAATAMRAAEAVSGGKPRILVTERPLDVIETDGAATYAPIPGTTLLTIVNTDADVFLDTTDQVHYALFAGRWHATSSLERGPWRLVMPESLPADFARIPAHSAKGGVLAHVSGTALAEVAMRDAQTPVVQSVPRTAPASVAVEYHGAPAFEQVESLPVYYAVNSPYTVIRVEPHYYLCFDGVWYWSSLAHGPWHAAVHVPTVIYTIPPRHPLYPVTHVRIYDWTPQRVYVGHTSGYFGWHIGYARSGLVFGIASGSISAWYYSGPVRHVHPRPVNHTTVITNTIIYPGPRYHYRSSTPHHASPARQRDAAGQRLAPARQRHAPTRYPLASTAARRQTVGVHPTASRNRGPTRSDTVSTAPVHAPRATDARFMPHTTPAPDGTRRGEPVPFTVPRPPERTERGATRQEPPGIDGRRSEARPHTVQPPPPTAPERLRTPARPSAVVRNAPQPTLSDRPAPDHARPPESRERPSVAPRIAGPASPPTPSSPPPPSPSPRPVTAGRVPVEPQRGTRLVPAPGMDASPQRVPDVRQPAPRAPLPPSPTVSREARRLGPPPASAPAIGASRGTRPETFGDAMTAAPPARQTRGARVAPVPVMPGAPALPIQSAPPDSRSDTERERERGRSRRW